MTKKKEKVNHPSHYNQHPSGVECIEIIRWMPHNVGAAIKYQWRAGLKDEEEDITDLRKAIFYLNDEIKRLEMLKKMKKEKKNGRNDLSQRNKKRTSSRSSSSSTRRN